MGGGAQGVFALDVTAPESFGVDNVLWEFTDADDPQMGNVVTQPVLMKLKVPGESGSPATYKWFVVVGSGYNNYKSDGHVTTTGAQALFFLSVDKAANAAWQAGTNYFKVELPVANGAIANGLSNPGFLTGPGGEATLLYAGDLQGNIWKFDLTAGINNANLADSVFQASGLRKALFVATTPSGTAQPITTTPQVVEANASGYMVVFGTGKYVEPSDNSTADVQSIYGIWDSLENSVTTYTAPRSSLFQRTASLSGTSVVLSTATFAFGTNSSASPAQYRGWYINLPQTRERIAVEPALGIGIVAFSAAIPEGTCSGDGTGRRYCLNPVFGTNQGCDTNATPGIPSGPKIIQYELDATSYTARTPSGRRTVTIEQKVLNSSTKITDAGNALVSSSTVQSISIPAGRINWRELRQ
jgi:type IV pilus assembly protein PilY1